MKGSLALIEKSSNDSLLPNGISRRDFVNGTLVDFGTALLTSNIPAIADSNVTPAVFSDPCSGYGGIGDYANSNGNVAAVREAAHLIR
jgi:spermidine dehydrogenase